MTQVVFDQLIDQFADAGAAGAAVTMWTCFFTTSSALSTAAEASHIFRNASSFSASPMPTVL